MKTFVNGDVPCGGCRLCCENELVLLEHEEELDYATEDHPARAGRKVVAHKSDRTCVYLDEKGCSIHEKRPKLCRDFDCRVLAVRWKWGQAQTLGIGDTWARGRELLKEA